jgi:hypothetical protein
MYLFSYITKIAIYRSSKGQLGHCDIPPLNKVG